MSRILADHGYHCGLAGKLHLASCANGQVEERIDDGYHDFHWSHHPQPDWPENAYSQWLEKQGTSWHELHGEPVSDYVTIGVPAPYHQTTWCGQMAVDFIRQRAQSGQPWMFSFNCFDPHHPFDPPRDYLERFSSDEMPLPQWTDNEWSDKSPYQQLDHEWAHNEVDGFHVAAMNEDDHRLVKAAYYAMIALIDDTVGSMLAALEETGQSENTIVIFMSDHGEMLGDHGLYYKGPHFYEAAVHAPVILRWPNRYLASHEITDLVELVDLVPTLLESASIPIPLGVQGKSLLSRCTQQVADSPPHRSHVYCEYYNAWTHPRSYGTMMRTDNEKIVVYHGIDEGELYDLRLDPTESNNLWNVAEAAEMRHRLLKQAFDTSVFTMDPLPPRKGPF